MRTRQLLPTILVVLLVTDLVGGVLDVMEGRSSWASAWGPDATLCAPVPMIGFQIVTVLAASRMRGRAGRIAASLLAAACFVSILSGFFDGQLGRSDLAPGEVVFQVWLLVVTTGLGAVATALTLSRPLRLRSRTGV